MVWIVGAITAFLLSFAAARWLPDLSTRAPDDVSKPALGTSISTAAATTPSVQQPDNSRTVTPTPIIPIVIRRSTLPDVETSDLRPDAEISPSPPPVPESVDAVTSRQLLDLHEIEGAKRVQQRLKDLGFLFEAADGVWGLRSRRALQDFRAANGLGDGDTFDEATQERLLAADANVADTSAVGFIGKWGADSAECRKSPLKITARRAANAFSTTCDFHSTQRQSSNLWRLQAVCSNNSERWNANVQFTLSGSKLTWSSERGTTTYVRCPS